MKKPRKTIKRTLTTKQVKANKLILENNGNVSKSLRQAGYAPGYAKNPRLYMATAAGQTLAAVCDDLRDKALAEAKKKLKKAKFIDLTHGAETLNKMSRLETGADDGERDIVIKIETFKQ